ncbi:MAG: hypothetical protein WC519_00435 [Parcubacteria group bacterium]
MKAKSKTNEKRRKFLKLLAFGGIALVAAKIFGNKFAALAAPAASLAGGQGKKTENKKVTGEQVDVVENETQVAFVDRRTGEEIFILEKD